MPSNLKPTKTNQKRTMAAVYIRLLRAHGVGAEALTGPSVEDLPVLGQLVTSVPKNEIP